MTAFTSGHVIITTGKNQPLPRDQGLARGECLTAITTVPGYLALLVIGRISCGGESYFNSVLVAVGNFICIGIAYSCIIFVFVFFLVIMTVPIMWAVLSFCLSLSSSPWRLGLRRRVQVKHGWKHAVTTQHKACRICV